MSETTSIFDTVPAFYKVYNTLYSVIADSRCNTAVFNREDCVSPALLTALRESGFEYCGTEYGNIGITLAPVKAAIVDTGLGVEEIFSTVFGRAVLYGIHQHTAKDSDILPVVPGVSVDNITTPILGIEQMREALRMSLYLLCHHGWYSLIRYRGNGSYSLIICFDSALCVNPVRPRELPEYTTDIL